MERGGQPLFPSPPLLAKVNLLGEGVCVDIGGYLEKVRSQYASGNATEHSYRHALHALFESIDPGLTVINEPKKPEAGMPDFLFRRGYISLGWAEAFE